MEGQRLMTTEEAKAWDEGAIWSLGQIYKSASQVCEELGKSAITIKEFGRLIERCKRHVMEGGMVAALNRTANASPTEAEAPAGGNK